MQEHKTFFILKKSNSNPAFQNPKLLLWKQNSEVFCHREIQLLVTDILQDLRSEESSALNSLLAPSWVFL
jgi:hypothetical protein